MNDIPNRNGDIFSNEIKGAMDRALKEYIERNKGSIQEMVQPYVGKPVSTCLKPMTDTIVRGVSSLYQQLDPNMKKVYCRCKCGKFCRYNGCKVCGTTDVKVVYQCRFPKPAEYIELNFTV